MENVNCVAVEWKKGVKTQYAVAVNNVRVVAAQVASMINFLTVKTNQFISNIFPFINLQSAFFFFFFKVLQHVQLNHVATMWPYCVMQENYKQNSDKFHLIGHGVGAHAAGDVGSRIPGLRRITGAVDGSHSAVCAVQELSNQVCICSPCEGLDPAEPYFQGTGSSVCLDTSDAAFVDVIHTDGLPFNSNLGTFLLDTNSRNNRGDQVRA